MPTGGISCFHSSWSEVAMFMFRQPSEHLEEMWDLQTHSLFCNGSSSVGRRHAQSALSPGYHCNLLLYRKIVTVWEINIEFLFLSFINILCNRVKVAQGNMLGAGPSQRRGLICVVVWLLTGEASGFGLLAPLNMLNSAHF